MDLAEEPSTLYHAALAHGANHLVTVVAQAREALVRGGVRDPRRGAPASARGGARRSPRGGGRGADRTRRRGDAGTVAGHRQELARHAPQVLTAYDALAGATLDRVVADGRLDAVRAAGVRRALGAHERQEARR